MPQNEVMTFHDAGWHSDTVAEHDRPPATAATRELVGAYRIFEGEQTP